MTDEVAASSVCQECAKCQAEIADLKAMVVSLETNHAEVVKNLERKYNEEVASMQILLNEAAAEASSLTSRKFEQERTKLFESNNEMESEINRLRKLVIENARVQQQQQPQQPVSPSHLDVRESNLSADSAQMFEDEIEMLKIQLATANQEITKLTLEKEKRDKAENKAENKADKSPMTEGEAECLRAEETEAILDRLSLAESQVKQLLGKLARSETELANVRSTTADGFSKAKHELHKLRERFQSVVEVNRRLTFYYAKKSRELREEDINLPATFDELMTSALMLREQVILERSNRELLKEKTAQEADLLRSELMAEQHEKQQMEQLLASEIDSLRNELAKYRSHSGLPMHAEETPIVQKMVPQDAEFEAVKREKAALEAEVNNLRQQCTRLQVELDTSESVQQDLVRLSQSLQVSLEGLRDQSEVRWEFDDEVDRCRGCKKTLPVSHQKLHCRHCGKIFCNECLAQSVPSGAARRPAPVCAQCHFLLVQEAKPYFTESSES